MSKSLTYLRILLLCAVLSHFFPAILAAQRDTLLRELWVGEFNQTAPMPWSGPMELFMRYDYTESYPKTIEGVVTWKSLNKARVRFKGSLSETGITFKTTECISGGCSEFIIGGSYQGTFNDIHTEIRGTAVFKQRGLQGDFILRKIIIPEKLE